MNFELFRGAPRYPQKGGEKDAVNAPAPGRQRTRTRTRSSTHPHPHPVVKGFCSVARQLVCQRQEIKQRPHQEKRRCHNSVENSVVVKLVVTHYSLQSKKQKRGEDTQCAPSSYLT